MRVIILIGTLMGVLPSAVTAQGHSAAVAAVIEDLVAANQILAAEGILPGYGHVSARHPEDPNRYFLSRAIAPELVTTDDIVSTQLSLGRWVGNLRSISVTDFEGLWNGTETTNGGGVPLKIATQPSVPTMKNSTEGAGNCALR